MVAPPATGDSGNYRPPKLKPKEAKLVQGSISVGLRVEDNKSGVGKQHRFVRSGPQKTLNLTVFVEIQILKCRDLMVCNRFGEVAQRNYLMTQ